jgi:hypothetical protein
MDINLMQFSYLVPEVLNLLNQNRKLDLDGSGFSN